MNEIDRVKKELLSEWQELRTSIDQVFYYIEEEDFQRKWTKKDSWTVAETLYHINMVNRHLLDQLLALKSSSTKLKGKLPTSLYAKLLLPSLPKENQGVSKRSYKTLAKTDPIKKQAKGYAIVPKVIFADLLADLDDLKALIGQLDKTDIATKKVRGLIKLFSIYSYEALQIMVRHSRRHIVQAENILKGK